MKKYLFSWLSEEEKSHSCGLGLVGNLQQAPPHTVPSRNNKYRCRIDQMTKQDCLAQQRPLGTQISSPRVLYCLQVELVLPPSWREQGKALRGACWQDNRCFPGRAVTPMLMRGGRELGTFVSIKFSRGGDMCSMRMCFFNHPPPQVWKWVGANDKWQRDASFVSPTSGVKWRLAATIRAANGVFSLLRRLYFCEMLRGWRRPLRFKMILRNNPKASFIPGTSLDTQAEKQILRQRAFLFPLYQPPPLTAAARSRVSIWCCPPFPGWKSP